MKKYLLAFILVLAGLSSNAQIYKSIQYYDKFDDEIKLEHRKTLISKTDSSTFVIEEKGKKPVEYYILNSVADGTRGSKDEPVNLVASVYGYEESWCVVRSDMLNDYLEAARAYSLDSSKEKMDKLMHFWLYIVHRTITTQYTGTYLDELFWIQDDLSDGKLGKDINRIIYLKQ
ncbi:hypothetical protein [Xylanibacter brevis]|uniref:hypothetical protein n=1 Tax=Xylanibacter brevis TaxID=83231 RepID=UPI0012DE54A0|nr:hypothetical protein [Xylanibacter brevis]